MAWFFAAVVLLLLVYVPKFRVVTVGVLGAVTILGVGAWGYYTWAESRSKKLIKPSEVAFEDLRLTASSDEWALAGRIRNNSSSYTLSGIAIDVTIRDCISPPLPRMSDDPDERISQIKGEISRIERDLLGAPPAPPSDSAKCDIIGQKEVRVTSLDVPSGQVRNIEESIYFSSGTKVRNTMKWSYAISSLTGR